MIPYFRFLKSRVSLEQYQDIRAYLSSDKDVEQFFAEMFEQEPDEQHPLYVEIEYYER